MFFSNIDVFKYVHTGSLKLLILLMLTKSMHFKKKTRPSQFHRYYEATSCNVQKDFIPICPYIVHGELQIFIIFIYIYYVLYNMYIYISIIK